MAQNDRPPVFCMIYRSNLHISISHLLHIPFWSQIFHNECFNLGLPTFSFVSIIVKMSMVKYLAASVPGNQLDDKIRDGNQPQMEKYHLRTHLGFKPMQTQPLVTQQSWTAHLSLDYLDHHPSLFSCLFQNICSQHRCLCHNKMRLTQTVRCTGQAVGPTGCCSTRTLVTSTQVHSRLLQQTRSQQSSRTPT